MARCLCKTVEGKRCKLTAEKGKVYCHVHAHSTSRCNALRGKKKSPKRAKRSPKKK